MAKKQKNFRFDDETLERLEFVRQSWEKEMNELYSEKGLSPVPFSETSVLTTLIHWEYEKLKGNN